MLQNPPTVSPAPVAPYGDLICELKLASLRDQKGFKQKLKISDCEDVASYSLAKTEPPSLLIPGKPATWHEKTLPCTIPADKGVFYRDQNGAHFPDHPMQPTVQAVYAMDADFDSSTVDIVGCASSLGNLLRCVGSDEVDFRIDLEMVGDTLFLIRNIKDELVPDVVGYGINFLADFARHASSKAHIATHQRIITYRFGGLKLLVRFESDGYFPEKVAKKEPPLSPGAKSSLSREPNSIPVTLEGAKIPQHAIFEIKTRSKRRGLDMSEHLPRLWVRQIPYLVLGYHDRGVFDDVQKRDVRTEVLKWETLQQDELRGFASVLRQLVTEVKRTGYQKLELCRRAGGPLEVRKQAEPERDALPAHWRDRWAGNVDSGSDDTDASRSEADSRVEVAERKVKTPTSINEGESDGAEAGKADQAEQKDRPAGAEGDDQPRAALGKSIDSADELSDSEDDDYALDYTSCGPACGYCGRCS